MPIGKLKSPALLLTPQEQGSLIAQARLGPHAEELAEECVIPRTLVRYVGAQELARLPERIERGGIEVRCDVRARLWREVAQEADPAPAIDSLPVSMLVLGSRSSERVFGSLLSGFLVWAMAHKIGGGNKLGLASAGEGALLLVSTMEVLIKQRN